MRIPENPPGRLHLRRDRAAAPGRRRSSQGSTCVPDPAQRRAVRGARLAPHSGEARPAHAALGRRLLGRARHRAGPSSQAAADVKLGSWVSTVKLEEARRRVADALQGGGLRVRRREVRARAVARSHARARPLPRHRGRAGRSSGRSWCAATCSRTRTPSSGASRSMVGQPYRASLVRKTEERIATLGAFASVDVALENPYVPQRNKVVIITVVERPRQYTEVAPGFSTGEGFRLATEYGHRNLWGNAVQLTLRLQLAYIPTPLIIDPTARNNYRDLELIARLGMRATGSIVLPGDRPRSARPHGRRRHPRPRSPARLLHHEARRDPERQLAARQRVPGHALQQLRVQQQPDLPVRERSTRTCSRSRSRASTRPISCASCSSPTARATSSPQRILVSWDRRDNAFNASRGTYIVSGIEHVDGFPLQSLDAARDAGVAAAQREPFLQVHARRSAGYIPLPQGACASRR